MRDHQIKCEHCGEWTSGKHDTCVHCGGVIREKEKQKQRDSKRLFDPLQPQLIPIHDTDPVWLKLAKRTVQLGQLIFYAIISFLVWITTWTVG